jgi:hypothetical protein
VKPFTDLLLSVHNGEVDVADLTIEQQEVVLAGYKELAESLADNPEFNSMAAIILDVINAVDPKDPFEAAIAEAESRGNTYWELETNSTH